MSFWQRFVKGFKELFGIGADSKVTYVVEGELTLGQRLWNRIARGGRYESAVDAAEGNTVDELDLPPIDSDKKPEAPEAEETVSPLERKLRELEQDESLKAGVEAVRDYIEQTDDKKMANLIMLGNRDVVRSALVDIGETTEEMRRMHVGEMSAVLQGMKGHEQENVQFNARNAVRARAGENPEMKKAAAAICGFLTGRDAKPLAEMIQGGAYGKKSSETEANIKRLLETVAAAPEKERTNMLKAINGNVKAFTEGKPIMPEQPGLERNK